MPDDDIGNHEISMIHVAITNALPTVFFTIVYIFSDVQLIADLQAELSSTLKREGRECTLDISAFMASWPLLNSVSCEVMRLVNRQTVGMGACAMEFQCWRWTPEDLDATLISLLYNWLG